MMYCSRYRVFALLCFWWSTEYAAADDHGVVFLYPEENLTINYLDTVNVTYTSPFPAPQLWIFCQNATDVTSGIITESSRTSVPAYNATVPVNFKWLGGSPCWFDIKPDATGGLGANSPHFVVDQNKRATPSTLGLNTATATATTTSTTSIASSTPTTSSDASNDSTTTATSTPTASSDAISNSSTNTPSSTQNNSTGGLSGGAKAGIGIGIAIVVLLALAAAFFFRRRKQARTTDYMVYENPVGEKMPADANISSSDYTKVNPQEHVTYEMYAPDAQYEMPATRPVGELSGDGNGNGRQMDGAAQSMSLGRGS